MKHLSLAAAAMITAALSMSTAANAADRIRFECRATGATDISMAARYQVRATGRKQFTAEFEAGPNTGFLAGTRLNVRVNDVKVGTMLLEPILGGDVVGDLNFDTRPQPPDSIAFPANWPVNVGRGTSVNVMRGTRLVLGCTLR